MKIFSTWKLPASAKDILKTYSITENLSGELLKREEILEGMKESSAVFTLLTDTVDAEMINSCPELKIIANVAAGFNNIDVEAARKRGIVVTNTPDILTDATADLTLALILSVARRIVEADKFMREGKFTGWRPDLFLGMDMADSVVGIFGMGRIGRAVAKRLKAFSSKIIYHNRTKLPDELERESGAEYVSFDKLLTRSDIICILAPLTDETRGRFTKEEFLKMKDGAILVNVGRGPIVKEDDLVSALKTGKLSAAGLDVYEFEPEVNAELYRLNNVVLLPHIGSAGALTRDRMFELSAKNIYNVLNGKDPLTPVKAK